MIQPPPLYLTNPLPLANTFFTELHFLRLSANLRITLSNFGFTTNWQ